MHIYLYLIVPAQREININQQHFLVMLLIDINSFRSSWDLISKWNFQDIYLATSFSKLELNFPKDIIVLVLDRLIVKQLFYYMFLEFILEDEKKHGKLVIYQSSVKIIVNSLSKIVDFKHILCATKKIKTNTATIILIKRNIMFCSLITISMIQ